MHRVCDGARQYLRRDIPTRPVRGPQLAGDDLRLAEHNLKHTAATVRAGNDLTRRHMASTAVLSRDRVEGDPGLVRSPIRWDRHLRQGAGLDRVAADIPVPDDLFHPDHLFASELIDTQCGSREETVEHT